MIRESLKKVDGVDEAYLYGSFAKNQQDAARDIDILVIGGPGEEVLAQAARKLERELGRQDLDSKGVRLPSCSQGCLP